MANRTYYTPLDDGQKVEEKYLPSYVDDVLEFENLAAFPETGETGKIYLALDNNFTYRWSGSTYVFIGNEFNLSDRMAKGVDGNGAVVDGAVVEGDIANNKATGNKSHAEGYKTEASGTYSHAGGQGTKASRESQTVIGEYNVEDTAGNGPNTRGNYAFIIGNGTYDFNRSNAFAVTWDGSVIEGSGKITNNAAFAHAEGSSTTASSQASHAEGSGTTASGFASHAEGLDTNASSSYSHAEGSNSTASGSSSHAEGSSGTASNSYSHAEGYYTTASGNSSHAEGNTTIASGSASHAEGYITTASGTYSHSSGYYTKASRAYQTVIGAYNVEDTAGANGTAKGDYAFIIGNGTYDNARSNAFTVKWDGSVREGSGPAVTGTAAHAEGQGTTASGQGSHAEGGGTQASGIYSHTEGAGSKATADNAHAEGSGTTASGSASHTEGGATTASGGSSHAEGSGTNASGYASHAGGYATIASRKSQTVIGEYNVEDTTGANGTVRGDYAFIVGNGTSDSARSNAFAIKWDGTFVFADGTEITPAQFASIKALLNG